MKKSWFYFSLSLNVLLVGILFLLYNSLSATAHESKYIAQQRLSNIQTLETLLEGRISKKDAMYLIRKKFPDEFMVDIRKTEAGTTSNVIDLGGMVLIFDEKDQFVMVALNRFEGP